jgi:hypothetical protein
MKEATPACRQAGSAQRGRGIPRLLPTIGRAGRSVFSRKMLSEKHNGKDNRFEC